MIPVSTVQHQGGQDIYALQTVNRTWVIFSQFLTDFSRNLIFAEGFQEFYGTAPRSGRWGMMRGAGLVIFVTLELGVQIKEENKLKRLTCRASGHRYARVTTLVVVAAPRL